MLSRPTTEQVLLDARNELLTSIGGAIDDPGVQIAIQMLESVLRNAATRAAHEIAWMRDETEEMVTFAERVAGSRAVAEPLTEALQAYHAGRSDSLHLDDVAASYALAGECLSTALEAAMAAGDDELHAAGRAVLEVRLAHEMEIVGEWAMVGRG